MLRPCGDSHVNNQLCCTQFTSLFWKSLIVHLPKPQQRIPLLRQLLYLHACTCESELCCMCMHAAAHQHMACEQHSGSDTVDGEHLFEQLCHARFLAARRADGGFQPAHCSVQHALQLPMPLCMTMHVRAVTASIT